MAETDSTASGSCTEDPFVAVLICASKLINANKGFFRLAADCPGPEDPDHPNLDSTWQDQAGIWQDFLRQCFQNCDMYINHLGIRSIHLPK